MSDDKDMRFEDFYLAVYIALSIIILTLNIAEAVIILKRKRMIKSFEVLLLNLSFAGTLTGLLSIFIVVYIASLNGRGSELNVEYTVIVAMTVAFESTTAFVFAIAVDRFAAVKYPLWHRSKVSVRRTRNLAACLWLISVCVTAVLATIYFTTKNGGSKGTAIQNTFRLTSAISIFSFDVIFALINIETVRAIIKQREKTQKIIARKSSNDHRDREINLIITTTMVVASYFICTLPKGIALLAYKPKTDVYLGLMVNAAVNPVIYFFKNRKEKRQRKKLEKNDQHETKTTDLQKTSRHEESMLAKQHISKIDNDLTNETLL